MNAKANTAPPRILLVGLPYGLPDADQDEFYTDKHFLDYDIVIFDPLGALKGPSHDYTNKIHDGVLSLDDRGTFHKRYTRTTQKLVNFVNKGGLAIVFLRPMPILNYLEPDGYRETVVKSLSEYLPWGESRIHKAHGSNIEFITNGAIGRFWEATNEHWSYEAVFNKPPNGPPLAHVRGFSEEVVADFIVTEERGFAIMTPVPSFGNLGGTVKDLSTSQRLFVQAIRDLREALQTEGPEPQLPIWASDYRLPGETELRTRISDANAQINDLHEQVRQRTKTLDELCLHKLLLTAHDSILEGAIDRVLTDLGLKVEPGPKGRVDRTAIYGDRKFAVEVQGVKRGAKEDHARALTIWVQDVALQDGQEPKGLLVVNPYRDTPLAERGGNNRWPGDTIKICKRQGHCAITGLQLLGLYLDAMADDTKREELIERMFSTEGLFKGYEDWTQFLAPVENKTPAKG